MILPCSLTNADLRSYNPDCDPIAVNLTPMRIAFRPALRGGGSRSGEALRPRSFNRAPGIGRTLTGGSSEFARWLEGYNLDSRYLTTRFRGKSLETSWRTCGYNRCQWRLYLLYL